MKDNFIFREMKEEDTDKILEILMKKGGHYLSDPSNTAIQLKENKVMVYEDGSIKGFSFIEVHPKISQIILYVDPEFRKNGIGSIMWKESLKILQELDPNTIWVFFRNDIGSSSEFYKSKGCKEWYAYHYMEYRGMKFYESNLEIRKFEESFFETFLEEKAKAFLDLNNKIKSFPADERERRDEVYKHSIENKDNIYLFFDDDIFVGAITVDDNFIDELFVVKERQGKGYGQKIIEETTNMIIDRNKIPSLCVVTGNTEAANLYQKTGYKIIQTLEMQRTFSENKEPDLRGPIG